MKPQELRIGNWVVTKWEQLGDDIGQVEIIKKTEGCISGSYADWDKITPIPLTPEWLERFGKKQRFGYALYESTDFNIWWEPTGVIWMGRDGIEMAYPLMHIKYVHQLQNLYFALTGEELTE